MKTKILCGKLHAMSGVKHDGPQVIKIEGDRVTAIGPADDSARTGELVDLSAFTVLPGMVDAHTHLEFDVLAGNEFQQAEVPDHRIMLRMINRGIANLQMGITTLRLVGARNFLDIDYRRDIEAGDILGPRIITSARPIRSSLFGTRPNTQNHDGQDAIRRAIRENIRAGADMIKIFHSGVLMVHADSTWPIMSRAELDTCVEEAGRFGLDVAAHAYGGRSVDECLDAGVAVIEHGFFMTRAQYDRGASLDRWVVPTLGVFLNEPGLAEHPDWAPWQRERQYRAREETWKSIGLLTESGMKFALSTDANHGGLGYEAVFAAMGGMTNQQALEGVTVHGGVLCGRPGEIGVLKPGSFADLFAVEGDPMADIHAITEVRHVIKGGREVFPRIDTRRRPVAGGCPADAFPAH